MKTRIIIDSGIDISPALRDRFTIIPLAVHFGEEEYKDGVTITHSEFYEKLVESDVLPKTSQPSPALFAQAYEEVVNGGEEAVVLTISSELSGTCQSATLAAQDFEGKIYVVDTKNVAIGAGILAELALRFADEGMSAKNIAGKMEAEKEHICLVALLDTLEYLKKGGRISKTEAFAGGLLSIKPVIGVKDGVVVTLGKARGSKQGNNLLVQEIQKAGGVDFDKPVLLGYTGLSDALLQKYIRDSASLWEESTQELPSVVIGSAIGTHAGPGAIAAAFFRK